MFLSRRQLPLTLSDWENLHWKDDAYTRVWEKLDALFQHHGFTFWRRMDDYNQSLDGFPVIPNGFAYVPINDIGNTGLLDTFLPRPLQHAAQRDKRNYVVRVITAGGQGLNHLNILRILSHTFPDNLYSNNHILLMVEEIIYQDITFGVFPFVFSNLSGALNPDRTKSTVEDVLYMIMQALEGIIYIHGKNIAHRDLYTDNFLVDFYPCSSAGRTWTRPRVCLIDFESAVLFPDEVEPSERLVSGFPFPGLELENYKRRLAPELLLDDSHMYCPFSLDMFQFRCHLAQFLSDTGIEEVNNFWPPLLSDNPSDRPTAHEFFQKLGDYITVTPPKVLQKTYAYVEPPFAMFLPAATGLEQVTVST